MEPESERMTLGDLLVVARGAAPRTGRVAGTCVLCQRDMKDGLRLRDVVSGNFTGWAHLYAGEGMCPACAYLFSDQTFRKRSWVASLAGGFRELETEEVRPVLLDPPEPPWFAYARRQGHRQAWLACLHRVNHSRERYWLCHEDLEAPVLVTRAQVREMCALIDEALARGVTKTELLTGQAGTGTWRRALEEGGEALLREVARLAGTTAWEVIVRVTPAPGRVGAEDSGTAGARLPGGAVGEDAGEKEPARRLQPQGPSGRQSALAL